MYIYIYDSDQVSAMHAPPPPSPPPPAPYYFGGGGGRGGKTKQKEICNLFRACLYFEEDVLNQNR